MTELNQERPKDPSAARVFDRGRQFDPSTPLFRIRSFRLLFITRVASTTAFQMIGVIVGWHVYELTNSALHLGLIGLAQFLPQFFLMLPAGQIADRLNRRHVLWWCYALAFSSSAGLMFVAAHADAEPRSRSMLLVALNMTARTFEQPVMQALLPAMAPRAVLNRAIAAHISARQLSGADRSGARRRPLRVRAGVRLRRLHGARRSPPRSAPTCCPIPAGRRSRWS